MSSLLCPFCRGELRVIPGGSRPILDGSTWRRRKCQSCGQRFTTRELVAADQTKLRAVDRMLELVRAPK